MITAKHQHSHKNRIQRLVTICSRCFVTLWVLVGFVSTPLHANSVQGQSRIPKSLTERPPLGWNSYDCYGTSIKEAQFKACVDVLAEKLLPYGYNYAVIDAAWYNKSHRPGEEIEIANNKEVFQIEMDEYSRQWPALERYPSAANGKGFKPLADYVHSKGMKFGIHIMRGIALQAVKENSGILGTSYRARDIVNLNSLCPWSNKMLGVDVRKPGAQEYYNSLFDLYASWEVDFIKADDMMTPVYHKGEVEMMRKAIDQCGRPMVLSLSAGEAPPSYAQHLSSHANMWRISNDFWDRWDDVERMLELAVLWSPFIGNKGAWPDADMLPIGNLRIDHQNDSKWWRNEHLTAFSHDEITTVMNLWCILRSPLMWGGDPVTTPPKYRQYLTNRELLEVNQNSHNNRQIYNENDKVIWAADIPGSSSKYVALFNMADDKQTVNFEFYWEALKGPYVFRDLWKHAIVGEYSERFEIELPAHASVIYKVTPAK
ncbi:glycoside hydrolase family 27 protein [Planctomycetota bacterium]